LADVAKLADREDVILGGIVTNVKTGFTKTGKPYGVVTLEDFEGSGELFMMGEEWGQRAGMFAIGASVYITGKVKNRFMYNEKGPKDLKIGGVEFLQTIKERAIDRITISMMTDQVTDALVNDLTELLNENPGKTKLFFQLRDSAGKYHVLLRSKRDGIDVKNKLIDYINTHDGLAYSIN
jgi:DNA polymerase-3 subunit alpha